MGQTLYPLSGNCDAIFALITIPEDFMNQQLLFTPELEIAPLPGWLQTLTPPKRRPVLLMYNITSLHSDENLQPSSGKPIIDIPKYNEFVVVYPYIQFKDKTFNDQAPFCYLPVLYLDNWLAVEGGRIFYHYNKILTKIESLPNTFMIQKQQAYGSETEPAPESPLHMPDLLLATSFWPQRPSQPASSFGNFQAIKPIFELPVIEYDDSTSYYYTSQYVIQFSESTPLAPCFGIQLNNLCPNLPYGAIAIDSLLVNPLGAFYFSYTWYLSFWERI